MGTYDGDPNNWPDHVTIPDDSDPPTGAAMNPGFEGTLDRTAWLRSKLVVLAEAEYLVTTAGIVAPEGATIAIVEACGGGGGGGGGMNAQGADTHAAGGGGGGGSHLSIQFVPVVAGSSYDVTIGAGGAGGAAEANGTGGGATLLLLSGVIKAAFFGGGGGHKGKATANGPTGNTWGLGGAPAFGPLGFTDNPPAMDVTDLPDLYRSYLPGQGGAGVTSNNNAYKQVGNPSLNGYSGGSAGTGSTAVSGSFRGGGGGGGGGAGPYGGGGDAGNGGAPNSGGAGAAGGSGESAVANSGAGGGGGGTAGGSSTLVGAGGIGGTGGTGRLRIIWLKRGMV